MKTRFVLHFNTTDFFFFDKMSRQAGFITIVTVGKSAGSWICLLYRYYMKYRKSFLTLTGDPNFILSFSITIYVMYLRSLFTLSFSCIIVSDFSDRKYIIQSTLNFCLVTQIMNTFSKEKI